MASVSLPSSTQETTTTNGSIKASRTPASKATSRAKQAKFQKQKAAFATFLAASKPQESFSGNDLKSQYLSMKQNSDKKIKDLKEQLATDTREKIPNVDRTAVTKTCKQKLKSEAIWALGAIRKLKGKKKGGKKKTRQLFRKAIIGLTNNLLIQPELNGPPYDIQQKKVLKEYAKCYYGRAMLYSTQQRERAAFRLNASTFLKKIAPYDDSYNHKDKQVAEIGKLLFTSYIESIKHFEKKNAKDMKKHIEQQCTKAILALSAEAFANPTVKTDKWSQQYSLVKTVEHKHDIKWSCDNQTNASKSKPANGKSPTPAGKTVPSLFRYAKLDSSGVGFTARRIIKKNRCIISEPIIASRWANKMIACAECNKQIKSHWGFSCDFCTQVAFCSKLCARVSQLRSCHASGKCVNYCYKLGTPATLVHRLVELCGGPAGLVKILSKEGKTFPTFKEIVSQQETNNASSINIVALLTSGYAEQLNNIQLEKNLAIPLVESIHLSTVLQKEFAASELPANADDFEVFIFQMLRFITGNPLACAKIGRPGAKLPESNNSQIKKRRPKPFGKAIGLLDSMFHFSCKPNIRRQLNLRKGIIEYVAVKEIQPEEELSICWLTRKQAPELEQQTQNLHSKYAVRFMKAAVKDCLYCKTISPVSSQTETGQSVS